MFRLINDFIEICEYVFFLLLHIHGVHVSDIGDFQTTLPFKIHDDTLYSKSSL